MYFPTHEQALRTLLDHVDYLADPPACGITEPVGAALPREVITLCNEALKHPPEATERALATTTRGLMALLITAESRGIPNVATLRFAVESIMRDALNAARNEAVSESDTGPLTRSGFR